MKKRLIIFWFIGISALLISSILPVAAQKSERDSLLRLLGKSNPDSDRVELLRHIGYTLEQTDATGARAKYLAGLLLSRQLKSSFLEAGCLIDLGDLEQVNGKYDEAESYFRQALSIGSGIHSQLRIGSAYLNIGNSYLYRNQPEKAVRNYMQAAAPFEKINDNARLSALYANIEAVFFDLQNYNKSLQYGDMAIDRAKKAGNPGVTASAYVNTSNTMYKLGQKQCAIEYLKLSLKYARKAPEINHLQDAYQNLADRYLDVPNLTLAGNYADSSLHYARLIGTSEVLSYAFNIKGLIDLKTGKFTSAQLNLLASNKYAKANGGWKMLHDNYNSLAELDYERGSYRQAYKYEHLSASLKDSILKESVNKQVGELEIKYQTEKKEAQIYGLLKTRQLQELSLHQKNLVNTMLVVGIAVLALIAGLFFVNFKRKQLLSGQTTKLQTQRIRELEKEKQIVTMDSILKGQEDERSRMARDLHDGLGGMLSGVKLSLNGMQGNQIIDTRGAAGLSKTLDLLDNSISELRRIARNLMPEALLRFGLKDALSDFVHAVNDLDSGVHFSLNVFGLDNRLDSNTEIVIFRILQELVNNILKHAQATEGNIQLIRDGKRLSITVEDNGKGFDAKQLSDGLGMTNIRSRVEYLNGRLEIQSHSGSGTFVHVEIENL